MDGIRKVLTITLLLVVVTVFISGCVSPVENTPNKGIDLRYSLYGPVYVNSAYGGREPQWTAAVNITNAGSVGTDMFCVKLSLINNKTNEVADTRYLQGYCGNGCLEPGKYRAAQTTFSPGYQEKGYYRLKGESCGGEWPPVDAG